MANPAIAELYAICVTQARRPDFYRTFGVPDTLDGRFDMLLLHVFMLMHRMVKEGEAKQQLFDLMFYDMDRSLREMGVGDMSISKKIKPMISAFYGRGQAYEKAFSGSDADLAATLSRNLYNNANIDEKTLEKMVDYARRAVAMLAKQPLQDILSGRAGFPAPIVE
ncbi:MAG TPA: ubiquinol-cytochrome C chaperone family protein [Alphaproteobacteria bacterium]|nr:ubiquinol-cytochrome C chaperone family protein [Alphaproteobacteria bacterium]